MLVALLVLLAVAVQSTVPAITSPASLSALAAQSQSGVTAPVRAGMDTIVILTPPAKIIYIPICDPKMQYEMYNRVNVKGIVKDNLELGNTDTKRCESKPTDLSEKRNPVGAWNAETAYCLLTNSSQAPSGTPVFGSEIIVRNDNMLALPKQFGVSIEEVMKTGVIPVNCFKTQQLAVGTQPPPITTIPASADRGVTITPSGASDWEDVESFVNSLRTNQQQTNIPPSSGVNDLGNALLGSAFDDPKISELTQQQRVITNRNFDIEAQIATLAESCPSGNCTGEEYQANIDRLKSEKDANILQYQQNRIELLQLLNSRASQLTSPNMDLGKVLNPTGTLQNPQQVSNSNIENALRSAVPNIGSTFRNPSLIANNNSVSPFGGSCATRYICSGGVLYYQSANSYGSYGYSGAQCQTQVVQRCAYGCASLNGSNSTADGLGGIMSVIGGLFGGNSSATANSSNSCAYSPQNAQSQNQFGLGNLGKLLFGGDDEESQSQTCPRAPAQPDASQCTSGSWRPTSASRNGCTTGWQCVSATGGSASNPNPTAQLSCTPQVVESGSQVKLNYTCGNSTASKGTGFDTGGALSGTATAVASPPDGQNLATYTLTCLNQGVTTSAQCQVQINKSQIILVTNPSRVASGETSLIGWVTSGMKSCTVSSLEQQDFTTRNVGNTSVNGAATTSPITGLTHFQVDCQTHSGTIKTAVTTVNLK
jgi:hypothetical protein